MLINIVFMVIQFFQMYIFFSLTSMYFLYSIFNIVIPLYRNLKLNSCFIVIYSSYTSWTLSFVQTIQQCYLNLIVPVYGQSVIVSILMSFNFLAVLKVLCIHSNRVYWNFLFINIFYLSFVISQWYNSSSLTFSKNCVYFLYN